MNEMRKLMEMVKLDEMADHDKYITLNDLLNNFVDDVIYEMNEGMTKNVDQAVSNYIDDLNDAQNHLFIAVENEVATRVRKKLSRNRPLTGLKEGEDSAALHTANARHAALVKNILKLVDEGLREYKDIHPTYEQSAIKMAKIFKDIDKMIRIDKGRRLSFLGVEESKELTETTSEQYEVMLDMAGELGDKIAADNILDDHTNAWSQGLDRLSPEEITVNVDKHLTTASRRMIEKAHTYIERSFRKEG